MRRGTRGEGYEARRKRQERVANEAREQIAATSGKKKLERVRQGLRRVQLVNRDFQIGKPRKVRGEKGETSIVGGT